MSLDLDNFERLLARRHDVWTPLPKDQVGALVRRLRAAEAALEAIDDEELGCVIRMVDSMSLPLDMQPSRERWVRHLKELRDRRMWWRQEGGGVENRRRGRPRP